MRALGIFHQHLPGVTLISVVGELDAASAAEFDAYVHQARRRDDSLVFDLGELTFIDSTGLRVLLNTHLYVTRHGGVVHLAALQPLPAHIMELTQACVYLRVHPTVEEALRAALTSAPGGDDHDTACA
ncbi:STAS domain-containing protein [Bailinhaonella thermotolerans]|uniref:Anti-sigma factor antagonist n=1 Tax=Bailinhaonella thermotolerans TaxID=1070861 RepID=A0A3A4B411_9ACTN|nr:STAS domain-containing protein [Bailinhaonella thermotolerans]RJL32759.1 anti-sigma factor antagonist [Bailinhaonella thermotolerans]